MLAYDWVVPLEHQFLRARARILLCHIKKAGSGRAQKLNFLRRWLCHGTLYRNETGRSSRGAPKLNLHRTMSHAAGLVKFGIVFSTWLDQIAVKRAVSLIVERHGTRTTAEGAVRQLLA